jgi:hypothetical protein
MQFVLYYSDFQPFFAQVQSNNETQICLTTGYVNKFELPGISHYISRVPLVGNHCPTAFDFANTLKSAFLPNFIKAETCNESTVSYQYYFLRN